MTLLEHPKLRGTLDGLIRGMLEYMEKAKPNYSAADVDTCRASLASHAEMLDRIDERSAALELVQATVEKLNRLNEETGGELIETDQREEICAYLTQAGAIKGFNSDTEDITEPWREW